VNERPPGKSVLLVEDEPGVRQFAALALRMSGYSVIEAGSAFAAERAAGEFSGSIDLLMTDLHLPDGAGPALAEWMAVAWPGVRVLFLSGSAVDEQFTEAERAVPGFAFLKKPFRLNELNLAVQTALARR
jgi:two-component system, cell cycle sensor histidine kinase and response regulator CckA